MIFKNKLCNVNTVKSLMLKFVPYTKQAIYIDGKRKIQKIVVERKKEEVFVSFLLFLILVSGGNYMERPLHNFIEAHISNKTNLFLIEHPDRKDVKEEINHAIHSHQAPEKVLKRQKEDYSLETRTSDYHSHHLYLGTKFFFFFFHFFIPFPFFFSLFFFFSSFECYLGNFHYRRNVGPARAFGCLWFSSFFSLFFFLLSFLILFQVC